MLREVLLWEGAILPLVGGWYPSLHEVQGNILGNCFGPYIRWADLPMVLCMDFAQGFGHDVFLSMVFYRSGQGNYDYVLIHG